MACKSYPFQWMSVVVAWREELLGCLKHAAAMAGPSWNLEAQMCKGSSKEAEIFQCFTESSFTSLVLVLQNSKGSYRLCIFTVL